MKQLKLSSQLSETTSILVVDDSRSYRYLLTNLLIEWGFKVFEAENGQHALQMIAQHPINMVISDWEMPVMDGLSLCTNIRQHDTGRYIYLILVTARQTVDDLILGLEAGADDFLSKPVNQSELQARLYAGKRILTLEATLANRNQKLALAYQQIEADLQIAARVQQSTLPSHPLEKSDFRVESLFLPSAYVSGDMLNYFALGPNHIGFYSIDVAGHGVGAAMMSLSVARQFLHGRTIEPLLLSSSPDKSNYVITPPHIVVSELNKRFCIENEDISSYFTLIYGIVNTQTGQGSLCQAGHPNPFLITENNEFSLISSGGYPVGLFDSMEYQESHFTLNKGERLFLFSDGISECENEQRQQFGDARLQNLLAHCNHLPLKETFALVQQALTDWRASASEDHISMSFHSNFTDDISLIAIERGY